MRCFSAQKAKRRFNGGENAVKLDDSDTSPAPVSSSSTPSFKSRVRAIQNAQRFINSNPRLRSSHPSYGSRDPPTSVSAAATSPISVGCRAVPLVPEIALAPSDVVATYHQSGPFPMPLPSPQHSSPISGYRLPLPNEHASCNIATAAAAASPSRISPKMNSNYIAPPTASPPSTVTSSTMSGHVNQYSAGNCPTSPDNPRFKTELQPLPLPKVAFLVPGLKVFSYEELIACASQESSDIGDDGDGCYSGTVRVSGKATKHQDVVIYEILQQQGFQEMLLGLSKVSQQNTRHVCKLVGFHSDHGNLQNMLVYEKLPKGNLSKLLFGASTNTSTLDWPARMKIACGAAQGLASLHESYPEKVLYRDFRTSSIQIDADYSSKVAGYRFVNTLEAESCFSTSNRVNAYTAPETRNRGEVTLKSNIWSYGIVLLELLSGKQNIDERATKDEKQSLVKWAKPFLMDEGRLFLIMDPKLQGKFPSKGAKMIADLVLKCLHKDPRKRPSMKEVSDTVKYVHEMRYMARFPSTKGSKSPIHTSSPFPTRSPVHMSSPLPANRSKSPQHMSSPLLTSSRTSEHHIANTYDTSYTRSPTKFDLIESPQLRPLVIPSRRCSSMEDMVHHHQQDYQSAPLGRVPGF